MSRVERMFGPRESWGKGDEMAAVRERAVRQEGGGPEKGRKDNPSVGKADSLCGDPVAALTVPRTVIHSRDCASLTPKRGAKMPPQSLRDSSPIPAGQGSFGNGAKEAKKAGFRRGGGAWGGLAGFVSIRCECGKVVNTCLHQRTPVFRCKNCGGETDLAHVSNIHMKCNRCGFVGKYRTNRTEEKIQMECLNCSDIVYLTKIRRGNYVVEGEQATGEGL